MSDHHADRPDRLRRKLLRSSALLGGALAAGHALPYAKPGSKSFMGISSAYAVQTPGFMFSGCFAEEEFGVAGEVNPSGLVSSITATVSPIPPVGTAISLTVTSTDPLNPTGTGSTAPTDAAGIAAFGDFDMFTDFGGAPTLPDGAVVSFTHAFVDTATFGTDTCVTNLTVDDPS